MRRFLAILVLALGVFVVAPVPPASADIVSDNAGWTCAVTRNTVNADHQIRHAHISGVGPGWHYYLCESYKGSKVCNYGSYFFNPGYNGGPGGPFGPINQTCH